MARYLSPFNSFILSDLEPRECQRDLRLCILDIRSCIRHLLYLFLYFFFDGANIFFPDQAKGFSELHRVLKNGGKVAVAAWTDIQRILDWFSSVL